MIVLYPAQRKKETKNYRKVKLIRMHSKILIRLQRLIIPFHQGICTFYHPFLVSTWLGMYNRYPPDAKYRRDEHNHNQKGLFYFSLSILPQCLLKTLKYTYCGSTNYKRNDMQK